MNAQETLDIDEAAALLRAEAETVLQFARKGELPGTRIGKSWVFLREDVLAFLKRQIAQDTEARRRKHASYAAHAVVLPTPAKSRRKPLPVLPHQPVSASHNGHHK